MKSFDHEGETLIRAVVREGPDFRPQIAAQRTSLPLQLNSLELMDTFQSFQDRGYTDIGMWRERALNQKKGIICGRSSGRMLGSFTSFFFF